MSGSDIHLNAEAEAVSNLSVETRQSVQIGEGPLEGFEGIVIDRRPSGRYLVWLYQGVYVETNCVRCGRA